MGAYISQDPIRLEAGLSNLYAYVHDVNAWVDPWGLTGTYMFTDGTIWYIGKGPNSRMYTSIQQRLPKGVPSVRQSLHIDYGSNDMGLMVEAELMRRHNAVANPAFANRINSPGEKMLRDAELNNKDLYNDVIQKADDFEEQFNKRSKVGRWY